MKNNNNLKELMMKGEKKSIKRIIKRAMMYGMVVTMLTMGMVGCSGTTDGNIPDEETLILEGLEELLMEDDSGLVDVAEEDLEDTEVLSNELPDDMEATNENTEETSEEMTETTSDIEETEAVEETLAEDMREIEESIPAYTVEAMTATMYAQKAVNVRIGPGTEYDKIGSLAINQEVEVTGKASTGWYEISYNGEKAYVSGNYLGNNKVAVEPVAPPSEQVNADTIVDETVTEQTGVTSERTYEVYLEPTMMDYVNSHRTANGVPEVTWNSDYDQIALDRIKSMAEKGELSHAGNPGDVETLTYVFGYTTADTYTFYSNYIDSPAHNKALLKKVDDALGYSMVSATCKVSGGGGVTAYYNVIIIFVEYPDYYTRVDWDNLGGF